ncbi:MAG: wax ester/triacylglycerol synthase family O-acyltransferase [Marmoricola sp.]|jgi:WS/DGAT/MGAT family acyltransferase
MAKKRLIPPQDAMFLWGETPETMMHVASLMPFTPPADAGPTYLRDLLQRVRESTVLSPFNLKLTHPHLLQHPLQAWVEDDKFDIDYHVRRSALASPGDERELGILVSRLHSHQLDFTRPPWEMHIIEGLEGGRFAIYTKVHHALVDGYSAVKSLGRSLTKDPSDPAVDFFTSLAPKSKPKAAPAQSASLVESLTAVAAGAAGMLGGAVSGATDVAKAVMKLEMTGKEDALKGGRDAPPTILNQRTSRTRRFATQVYETQRLRAIATASRGTLNDVVMTICGAALRRYLLELNELPDKSLVAFMPVNIRDAGDEGGGNKVAVLLAAMGTDVADPVQRLESVIASTSAAKGQMKGMGQLPALAYSGYLLAPGIAQTVAAMLGVRNLLPTTFNLILSNVPGPRHKLYLLGSELEAVYPISIPAHGMALNITLETYAEKMCFGFTGDRDALPSLQKLAVYTGDALAELESALDLPGAAMPGTDLARKKRARSSKATREALAPKPRKA